MSKNKKIFRSLGKGNEEIPCIIIKNIKVINIDYLKTEGKTQIKERVACF